MLTHEPYVDFCTRYFDNHPTLRHNDHLLAIYCFNDARKAFPELNRVDEDRGGFTTDYDLSINVWHDSLNEAVINWNLHNPEDRI